MSARRFTEFIYKRLKLGLCFSASRFWWLIFSIFWHQSANSELSCRNNNKGSTDFEYDILIWLSPTPCNWDFKLLLITKLCLSLLLKFALYANIQLLITEALQELNNVSRALRGYSNICWIELLMPNLHIFSKLLVKFFNQICLFCTIFMLWCYSNFCKFEFGQMEAASLSAEKSPPSFIQIRQNRNKWNIEICLCWS